MDTALRPPTRSPARTLLGFAGIFVVLYLCALAIAERNVGRAGTVTAFQKLLTARGQQVDWLVLGASHALPLEYGGVPTQVQKDAGQSMLVLAEIGAGPLYNLFVFEQALRDLEIKHLIYVVDSFAFGGADWNEDRLADRSLLRQTPLRYSTARTFSDLTFRYGADPRGLLDFLTGFSKLNPVDRFPKEGWQGAAKFDDRFRPSRHAVSARIAYLYPDGAAEAGTLERYLDILEALFGRAEAAGVGVQVVKMPVPDAFRKKLPGEEAFDEALRTRLRARRIEFEDLSGEIGDPDFYFDTDHLNRNGVAELYINHILPMIGLE